jgi:hypothetical protein
MASRTPSRPARSVQAPLAFSTVNRTCAAVLYGRVRRVGRLAAENGGFWPAQFGFLWGVVFPWVVALPLLYQVRAPPRAGPEDELGQLQPFFFLSNAT